MNRDFVEMLSVLSEGGVEFLIVGAHALAAHGVPRATGDLDIWIRPTVDNARRVLKALVVFGAPVESLDLSDLTASDTVFQIGIEPARIDILTGITAIDFERAWLNRIELDIEGQRLPILGRRELIENKRATGRTKDLADLEALQRMEP